MQQTKPCSHRRTCQPDKKNRRGTNKRRKPSSRSAPRSKWRRPRGKSKRSECPRTAIPAASTPSPGATGQGIASRRAFISRPAHTSSIHCPRVAERGNREGRISRRSSRSQRLQWIFSAINRPTIASKSPLRERCTANIFTRDKCKYGKSFRYRHSDGFCARAACQTGERNPNW